MLNFRDVCNLLDEVQSSKGLTNKAAVIEKGFTKFREDTHFDVQQNFELFYQGIRLIIPKMDHGRKSYYMKENKIARIIIKMLNISEGPDKRNLLNYYRIKNLNVKLDFADIVYNTLRKYISNKPSTVTAAQLNDYLDTIANRSSDTGLDEIMLQMFRKLTVQESKWVVRMMLKKLELGIDNNKILNIFHPDAVEYYTSNNNLRKVCEVLWNPSVKLNEFTLNLFEPFQPMLSKRCDAKSFTNEFPEKKLFFIENKFDGERFQLHMENGKFKYFSRNGYDYTDKFGETFSSGMVTPKLKGVFNNNVKRLILDGEMMLWNTKIKQFGSKGMKFDVKKLNVMGSYQPCFCVFDILLLNDEVLTNKELFERLKILRKVICQTIEGTIIISHYEESNSQNGIINALNEIMDKEGEGIVVKDPKSVYKFKDRKSGWYKIKMEYFEDVVTDLDLILMGGMYKSNCNELNSFLVGVYSDIENEHIFSMGRVSSGLNFEEIELINKKFIENGNEFNPEKRGKLMFGKDVPDVCIEPEDSLIFTVRATELIRTSNKEFKTPYTLRFPRVLRVRDDKTYKECLSNSELQDLCQQNKAVIKLNKRHLELDDILSVKRQKKVKKLIVDSEALKKSSNCLIGLKFFVLSETENFSKDRIEVLIGRYGGTFTLSLEKDVNIVLVGNNTPKVKELLKQENKFDIIKVGWLERVRDEDQLQHYKQEEVLSIGVSYYNCLADNVDQFGDSYTEEIDEESLSSRLQVMLERDCSSNINGSISFKSDLPLFNKYTSYFDEYEIINDFSSKQIYNAFLDQIEFTYRKGTVVGIMSPEVNLIVMESSDDYRKHLLEKYAKSIHSKNFLVIERRRLYDKKEL